LTASHTGYRTYVYGLTNISGAPGHFLERRTPTELCPFSAEFPGVLFSWRARPFLAGGMSLILAKTAMQIAAHNLQRAAADNQFFPRIAA